MDQEFCQLSGKYDISEEDGFSNAPNTLYADFQQKVKMESSGKEMAF